MDCFDYLPDSIIVDIFNAVSDVKTLTCCRAVSRRFNSLVPHANALLLRVDRVVPEPDPDSLFLSFFRTLLNSVHHFLSPHPAPELPNYPTRVLRGFARIRDLEIELPSGDLRLEKGTVVKYRAVFGERLRSCVILGFRHWRGGASAGQAQDGFGEGLKERVAWIVSALVGASARHHYVASEVAREHGGLARLAVRDRDGEGEVVMDELGLKEAAAAAVAGSHGEDPRALVLQTLRMSMRQERTAKIGGGGGSFLEGPMLVVVRPDEDDDHMAEDDAKLALEAFGSGAYGEVVRALLKSRSYLLEMNSF